MIKILRTLWTSTNLKADLKKAAFHRGMHTADLVEELITIGVGHCEDGTLQLQGLTFSEADGPREHCTSFSLGTTVDQKLRATAHKFTISKHVLVRLLLQRELAAHGITPPFRNNKP